MRFKQPLWNSYLLSFKILSVLLECFFLLYDKSTWIDLPMIMLWFLSPQRMVYFLFFFNASRGFFPNLFQMHVLSNMLNLTWTAFMDFFFFFWAFYNNRRKKGFLGLLSLFIKQTYHCLVGLKVPCSFWLLVSLNLYS